MKMRVFQLGLGIRASSASQQGAIEEGGKAPAGAAGFRKRNHSNIQFINTQTHTSETRLKRILSTLNVGVQQDFCFIHVQPAAGTGSDRSQSPIKTDQRSFCRNLRRFRFHRLLLGFKKKRKVDLQS